MLRRSHRWDNYQWKWDPRLILFLILRIMLSIIWERLKGLFRLFPSHSHNYTSVTWAEQVEKSTSCTLAALLMVCYMLVGSLVLLCCHICISKLWSPGYFLLDLYKTRSALRLYNYYINWHVLAYWCYLKSQPGMLHQLPCRNRSSVLKFTGKLGSRRLSRFPFFDCGNKYSKTQWYIRLH